LLNRTASGAATVVEKAEAPKYARFTRRLRGIQIDFMLFLIVVVCLLQTAVVLKSNELSQMIGLGAVVGFFLYEPLMVSLLGGTVGHYLSNLRVVDNRTNRNVSFLKATARVAIKALLGWYSFITMPAAKRHQAVHDLLTGSTVQISDLARAKAHHYGIERLELSLPSMPSRVRRILTIAAYLFVSFVVLALVMNMLLVTGIYSRTCGDHRLCSDAEKFVDIALGICVLGLLALFFGLGWKGRLWGARRGSPPS
jgi:hypothetical protein